MAARTASIASAAHRKRDIFRCPLLPLTRIKNRLNRFIPFPRRLSSQRTSYSEVAAAGKCAHVVERVDRHPALIRRAHLRFPPDRRGELVKLALDVVRLVRIRELAFWQIAPAFENRAVVEKDLQPRSPLRRKPTVEL